MRRKSPPPLRDEGSLSCAYVLADVALGVTPLDSPPQVQAIGLRGKVARAEVVLEPQGTRPFRDLAEIAQKALQPGRPDTFLLATGLLAQDDTWRVDAVEYLH